MFAVSRNHATKLVTLLNDEATDRWPLRLNLQSEKWGLTGKVDCIRRRDGMLIPYKHKRGRSARSADNKPEAWASDRLQVIAYAALIAEHSGQEVSEGRVRYHADGVMVRVPIDDAELKDLKEAIRRARVLQGSDRRTLRVLTHGARIGRKGDRLEISVIGEAPQLHPSREIGQIVRASRTFRCCCWAGRLIVPESDAI
ncbi:MAG: Dna2/Cas4 domain-containing protein, partial [bacterium]